MLFSLQTSCVFWDMSIETMKFHGTQVVFHSDISITLSSDYPLTLQFRNFSLPIYVSVYGYRLILHKCSQIKKVEGIVDT